MLETLTYEYVWLFNSFRFFIKITCMKEGFSLMIVSSVCKIKDRHVCPAKSNPTHITKRTV